MSLKIALLGVAALVAATSISLAQSLPNYGPNAPANADSFGQPPTGTMPQACLATGTAPMATTGTGTITTAIGIVVTGIDDVDKDGAEQPKYYSFASRR